MKYMVEDENADAYVRKARECLESAESDYAGGRYNSCANRCYYACFQAAIATLLRANIGTRQPGGRWGHDYVQAAFFGQIIKRRKLYPTSMGDTITMNRELRQTADYKSNSVTRKQAERALRRSREFVLAVPQSEEEGS